MRKVCLRQKAREVRRAKNEEERALLWKGRKTAFAALGRVSPSYYTQDGVVPRSKIPAVLQHIGDVARSTISSSATSSTPATAIFIR